MTDLQSMDLGDQGCFGNCDNPQLARKERTATRNQQKKDRQAVCPMNNFRRCNEVVNKRNRKKVSRGARLQQIRTLRQKGELKKKPPIALRYSTDESASFYLYKQYDEVDGIDEDPLEPRMHRDD